MPNPATHTGRARRAVLFDLDGTLVDSAPDLHASLNQLLAEHDRPAVTLADVRHIVGDGAAKMIERGFGLTGAPPTADALLGLLRRFLEIYEANLTRLTRPFPGVVQTLERLTAEGTLCGVCTNKLRGLSLRILEGLDMMRFFACVVGGDSTPARKPHPGHLLQTLGWMGSGPSHAAMVGDSRNDVAAARGAGIPVILVPWGYDAEPPHSLGADHVLTRFEELPDLLERAVFVA
ncbi:MAG: phosphoglycolate phosphatase [Rhodospirillaceae bacterium]|nr:phosphoglycolate phosphatase [Rhodospirillaceae bacterium]